MGATPVSKKAGSAPDAGSRAMPTGVTKYAIGPRKAVKKGRRSEPSPGSGTR
jgi:hypothetical protein